MAQLVEWHRRSAVRISPSQLLIASKCVYQTIEWNKTKINYEEARCGPIKKVPLKAPYQVMILRAKFAKRNLVLRSNLQKLAFQDLASGIVRVREAI